ncbi:hypothetical protein BSNK01_26570 [Bacillaceae bacterium]
MKKMAPGMRHVFRDVAGNEVCLTFDRKEFSPQASDVLVFPFYQGKIVMTQHSRRGLELPGGKVNAGEMPIQAAIREMWEETGGVLRGLQQIAQYTVAQKSGRRIVKAVYVAEVSHFEPLPSGFETNGYELLPPSIEVHDPKFSPYVKDQVFSLTMHRIREIGTSPFLSS